MGFKNVSANLLRIKFFDLKLAFDLFFSLFRVIIPNLFGILLTDSFLEPKTGF